MTVTSCEVTKEVIAMAAGWQEEDCTKTIRQRDVMGDEKDNGHRDILWSDKGGHSHALRVDLGCTNIVRRKGCASNVMQAHKGRLEVTVTSREVAKEVLVMSYGLTERGLCGCHQEKRRAGNVP